MDERKRRILQAIVEDYVLTAEPVGSRTIARKYGLGVSAATIRNEMADLEEMGYVEQPHASAGRIPSDRGYRFYVDELMEVKPLPPWVLERVQELCEGRVRAMEAVLQQVARLLSEVTNSLAILVGPQAGEMVFRSLDLVPVGPSRALLVAVADLGLLESGMVEVPADLTPAELHYISQVLTRGLRGLSVQALSHTILRELQAELARYRQVLEQVLEILVASAREQIPDRMYLVGLSTLLSQPEFHDRERLRAVISVLEQEVLARYLLMVSTEREQEAGVTVSIGRENPLGEVRDLSLVFTPYRVGVSRGRLAVVGPKRMDYGRVVGAVADFERLLSDLLGRWALV